MKNASSKYFVGTLFALVCFLISGRCTLAQTPEELARTQFLQVTRIARMPLAEQATQVPKLYKLMPWIRLSKGGAVSGVVITRPPLPENADTMTPEQIADAVTKSVGAKSLTAEAKAIGRELLRAHRNPVAVLIQSDLEAGRQGNIERAFDVLQDMGSGGNGEQLAGLPNSDRSLQQWFRSFYEDVMAIFQSGSPLAFRAATLFKYFGDARAIDALIERDAEHPTRFYEELSSLSHLAPPHPKLVELLDSTDAEVRRQALWALPDSADLLPQFQRLLSDGNPDVRWLAANHIFDLGEETIAQNRPSLIALLQDADANVRGVVAGEFAERKDAVAAPALLALLKDENLSESARAAVVQDIKTLTGSDFGYQPPTNKATEKANLAAMKQFEDWIKAHPAP